jgi:uncharacterized protein (TIGR03086 family)
VADRVPLDFNPPARQLRSLLLGIGDRELAAATPCEEWTVAALLVHIMGVCLAFTQAARKLTGATGADGPPPRPHAADLPPYWRSRMPVLIEELAAAWRDPAAWTGTSRVGGVTMPAATIGAFGMNELVMHSWDLARATGQEYAADPRILEALIELLSDGPPGVFGPAVEIEDEASLLDLAVSLAGRNPHWRPEKRGRPARDQYPDKGPPSPRPSPPNPGPSQSHPGTGQSSSAGTSHSNPGPGQSGPHKAQRSRERDQRSPDKGQLDPEEAREHPEEDAELSTPSTSAAE